MPGIWKRPVARVYDYNLGLGYHQEARRESDLRSKTPAPKSFASTLLADETRDRRARTELRSPYCEYNRTSGFGSSAQRSVQKEVSETIERSNQEADILLNSHRYAMASVDLPIRTPISRDNDDIYKRMADIRLSPWCGEEVEKEYRAAQQSRARITNLNRKLEDITRNTMTYRPMYEKSANQLAKEALEDDKFSAASYKKTRKVVMESY